VDWRLEIWLSLLQVPLQPLNPAEGVLQRQVLVRGVALGLPARGLELLGAAL